MLKVSLIALFLSTMGMLTMAAASMPVETQATLTVTDLAN